MKTIKIIVNRILSLILIFCMTLALPITVYAEENVSQKSQISDGTSSDIGTITGTDDNEPNEEDDSSSDNTEEEQSALGVNLTNTYFTFSSYDKVKTSSISYKTIGFTISRCIIPDPEITDTSDPNFAPVYYDSSTYITVPLYPSLFLNTNSDAYEVTSTPDSKGNITTTWAISAQWIYNAIKALAETNESYREWLYDLTECDDMSQYLMFNAVMTVCKNGNQTGWLDWSSEYSCAATGDVYIGNNVTVNGVTLTGVCKTQDDLKKAQKWADPSKIDTHFNKWYDFITQDPGEDDDPEPDEDPGDLDELVTYIGKKPTDVLTKKNQSTFYE